MSELMYLLAAVLISAIGSAIIVYRHRKPQTFDGALNQFSRGLEALAPEDSVKTHRRRSTRYGQRTRHVG